MSFSRNPVTFAWWILAPFLFSYLLFGIAWAILFLSSGSSNFALNAIEDFGQQNFHYIASAMHLLLFVFAFSRIKKESGFWEIKIKQLAWSVVVAILAIVIIIVTLNTLAFFNITLDFDNGEKSQLLFIALITSITAGFGEELYFRAFLFRVANNYNKWVVILLTSLSFAIWHPDWKWYLHTFAVGVLFGWFYSKKRKILPVIIAHILTDMSLGILAYMSLS